MVPNDQTEHVDLGKQNGGWTHRVDLRFWGAQAASLFISAACRDALRLRRGDVLEGCRASCRQLQAGSLCSPESTCRTQDGSVTPQELGGAHSSFTFELHFE